MTWWRRDALTCRRAVELVTAYLEGALGARERARYEAHLTDCDHCRAYLDQMRATIATLGALDERALPEPVRDELVVVYRRWLAD